MSDRKKAASKIDHNWILAYEGFDPEDQPLREAMTVCGNGYFCTRGAATEVVAGDVHYPGTYLAGGYNRLESLVSGRPLFNEDLVNFPNWLGLTYRHEDDDQWFRPMAVEMLDYRTELDMREGILTRFMHFRDKKGHETRVEERRFVHMGKPHYAGLEYKVTPINWSGAVQIRSMLDGSVVNAGVARYRQLNSKHLEVLEMGDVADDGIYIKARTNQSHTKMALAARTKVYLNGKEASVKYETKSEDELIYKLLDCQMEKGKTYTIEKLVSIYTSRDPAISECVADATRAITRVSRFEQLLKSHKQAWEFLWRRCDIEIDGPEKHQLILRLHIFHLLQSISMHSIDLDVGVPARGWHGEAYRGHIFWDELYIFPFYTLHVPEITKALLMYRYRRLSAAKRLAKEEGYLGAMYPWQSASDGMEETQAVHLNPRSNTWGPDLSRRQRHVNIAIAYNVWQYYKLTGDSSFLSTYGAEMFLSIAKFWSSIATFNDETGRYEINGVMGPDEYHEKYINSDELGLHNNAYTNIMAVWVFQRGLEILDVLHQDRKEELVAQIGIDEKELARWSDLSAKMTIPFHEDGKIISHFEGYENLEEFDWEGYREKYGNIERLDRILKSEEDTCDRYKVSKQADVLMLFYMLPQSELKKLFEMMGYAYDDGLEMRNIEYYQKRTSNGSTLSKIVNTAVLEKFDPELTKTLFHEALVSDIEDVQGGTTKEGVHLGAMAGTVDIVQRHYAGVDTSGDLLAFHPNLPDNVHHLKLRVQHLGQWYSVEVDDKQFKITLEQEGLGATEQDVMVNGKKVHLVPGETESFPIKK